MSEQQNIDKQNIGSLFDRIADKYDFLNHLLSLNIDRYWRRRAAATIQTKNGNVLDVAVGTADFAIAIAMQHKDLHICGIDLSQEMMRIGGDKVNKAALAHRISFKQCSALELPFADNSFDVVTCAYGVRNFSDLQKGLQEMCRVLKNNGELVLLEFSYPENRLMAWIYDLYFTHILPFVGRLVSKDKTAYTYLNRSVRNFVWGEQMCGCLQKAGFRNIAYRSLTFGITTLYTATK